jgi:hypothetical protein
MRTITQEQLQKLREEGQAVSIKGRWFVEVEIREETEPEVAKKLPEPAEDKAKHERKA